MGGKVIYYKTNEEIELIRQSCEIVSKALALVGSMLRPGITGLEIDQAAETLIRDHKAVPGFKGYQGFPGTLCISPNEEIVHGIPKNEAFKDGDIVSVDCGAILNGYYGDSAYTFAIGNVKDEVIQLMEVTQESLFRGIEQARVGKRMGDIGYAVQHFCEKEYPYGIVRELVGHGIGKDLHEAPEVPNYGRRGRGPMLKEGLVIAIEPMVNMGKKDVRHLKDGWTIITADKLPSAHFEHTVAIKKEGPDILTTYEYIEEAIKNNPEVKGISRKS